MKQFSNLPYVAGADQQTFEVTSGLDLGDKYSHLRLIETATGEILEETRVRTDPETLRRRFTVLEPIRIAIETGTHSPWVSRLLEDAGHEVLVANARKLGFIYKNSRKNDRLDAENLARVARLDPKLLSPIKHRGAAAQADLALLRTRDVLVKSRTQFINHLRGSVAETGEFVDDMIGAGIVDPAKVTRTALQNAASIGSLLLTTEAVIADRPEKEEPMPAGAGGGMGGMDF